MAESLLKDAYGRVFRYLRLSITDVCNFKCRYCLPNGYQKDPKKPRELSLEEIKKVIRAFAALGIQKVRITGGEPTCRRDLEDIVSFLVQDVKMAHVALTTNGLLFRKKARLLWEAGLRRVNISLDSFLSDRFEWLVQKEVFQEVKAALLEALEIGYHVKVNAVLLRGFNDDPASLEAFFDFVKQYPITLRFIELMQTGCHQKFFRRYHTRAATLLQKLQESGWSPLPRGKLSGPAVEFSHPSFRGKVGFILPYTRSFCASCNRLRVTAQGDLLLCLFGETRYSLRPWLSEDTPQLALENVILRLLRYKPLAHMLQEGRVGALTHLASVGG